MPAERESGWISIGNYREWRVEYPATTKGMVAAMKVVQRDLRGSKRRPGHKGACLYWRQLPGGRIILEKTATVWNFSNWGCGAKYTSFAETAADSSESCPSGVACSGTHAVDGALSIVDFHRSSARARQDRAKLRTRLCLIPTRCISTACEDGT